MEYLIVKLIYNLMIILFHLYEKEVRTMIYKVTSCHGELNLANYVKVIFFNTEFSWFF
jgi:hypothetical protein